MKVVARRRRKVRHSPEADTMHWFHGGFCLSWEVVRLGEIRFKFRDSKLGAYCGAKPISLLRT